MKSTVTIHGNRGLISREHNSRNREVCEKEVHIDLDNVHGQSTHEFWDIDGKSVKGVCDLHTTYQKLFGAAIEEYNAKQKRADRKITVDSYMQSIIDDTRGNKQTVIRNGKRVVSDVREGKQLEYEFTVKIGNCLPDGKNTKYDSSQHEIRPAYFPRELQRRVYQRYVKEFYSRNAKNGEGLCVSGIYYHADEGYTNKNNAFEYSPDHLHITYIPVAKGFEKGLSVQNSLNKAFRAIGCKGYTDWTKREQEALEQITKEEYEKYCKEHPDFYIKNGNLTITHPVADGKYTGDKEKEVYVRERKLQEREAAELHKLNEMEDNLHALEDIASESILKGRRMAHKASKKLGELQSKEIELQKQAEALQAREEAVQKREENIQKEVIRRVQERSELQERAENAYKQSELSKGKTREIPFP